MWPFLVPAIFLVIVRSFGNHKSTLSPANSVYARYLSGGGQPLLGSIESGRRRSLNFTFIFIKASTLHMCYWGFTARLERSIYCTDPFRHLSLGKEAPRRDFVKSARSLPGKPGETLRFVMIYTQRLFVMYLAPGRCPLSI